MNTMADPMEGMARLMEFCGIASVSSDRKAVEQAAAWLIDTFGQFADSVSVFREDDGCATGLLLEFKGTGGERVAFYNYYDVTPAGDESHWVSPPFTGAVREGRLYARGAASNKGDLVARLVAVSRLKVSGALNHDVTFWIDGQEEAGAPNLERMLDRWAPQLSSRLVIWNTGFINDAGVPIVCTGFKGLVVLSLRISVPDASPHSGVGLRHSAIHQLIDAVSPLLRLNGLNELRSISGMGDRLCEDNEILADGTGLLDIAIDQAATGVYGKRYARATRDKLIHAALFEATANLPWIHGGEREEVTRYAHTAECVLELRLVPSQRADDVITELSAYFERLGVHSEVLMKIDPYMMSRADRGDVMQSISRPLEIAFGQKPSILPIAPFSAAAGTVADRLQAVIVAVGITDSQSSPHGFNESISCDAFQKTVTAVSQLVGSTEC